MTTTKHPLAAEIEQFDARDGMAVAVGLLTAAAEQLDEFQHLFDLQWSRMQESIALYQAAHPEKNEQYPHGYWPDLGDMLDWMNNEIRRLREETPGG